MGPGGPSRKPFENVWQPVIPVNNRQASEQRNLVFIVSIMFPTTSGKSGGNYTNRMITRKDESDPLYQLLLGINKKNESPDKQLKVDTC